MEISQQHCHHPRPLSACPVGPPGRGGERGGYTPAGWVFYDGACSLCTRTARLFAGTLLRRNFRLAPLQRGWVQERLGVGLAQALTEMRVVTATGTILGGADALVYVARRIWWARPLDLLARIPGSMPVLRLFYRLVARHRHCAGRVCAPNR